MIIFRIVQIVFDFGIKQTLLTEKKNDKDDIDTKYTHFIYKSSINGEINHYNLNLLFGIEKFYVRTVMSSLFSK